MRSIDNSSEGRTFGHFGQLALAIALLDVVVHIIDLVVCGFVSIDNEK